MDPKRIINYWHSYVRYAHRHHHTYSQMMMKLTPQHYKVMGGKLRQGWEIWKFFLNQFILCLDSRSQPAPLHFECATSTLSQTHTHFVRFLWTGDRPVTECSTSQHTTIIRDRHSWQRWDSNRNTCKRASADPPFKTCGRWFIYLVLPNKNYHLPIFRNFWIYIYIYIYW